MTTVSDQKISLTSIVYFFLLVGVVAVISLLASVPPVSRDALTHHLYIPKLYLQFGRIYEIPHIKFSYYPMNLDMLYLIPLYFKNDILPKFIHFAFALATTAMIYRYLVRRINTDFALLGSLFFLSIPIIVCQSSTVYVDLGLVFFLFAALIYLFRWVEDHFNFKYLAISAVFCGLALGTKYNGLIGLFLIGLFVPLIYARYHAGEPSHSWKAIVHSAAYVFIALIVFSPWMIRNVIWTGNPVYPLYKSVFNSSAAPTQIADENESKTHHIAISHFQIRRELYGESDWELLLIPLRVFFQGRDDDPQYFDGRANPFLILLPIFAFLGIRSNSRQVMTEKLLMLGFSIFFLLFACVQTSIRIRYFAPIFPPLVLLSMFGLQYIQENIIGQNSRISGFLKRITVFLIIFVMLGLNAKYLIERFSFVQPVDYLTDKVTRDDYIQKYRPEFACLQYANRNLNKSHRILGLYIGNRAYYSDIDIMFDLDLLKDLASGADSAEEIYKGLRKKNITHLLINIELFNFYVKKYSLHQKQLLKDFFETYTLQEFERDGNGLLTVVHNP